MYYGGADGTTYLGNTHLEHADFGLDVYEPLFQRDRETWSEFAFNIKLTIDNADTADIFYFCHVHNWMSGRIKVCDGEGTSCTLRSTVDTPALYSFYSPDTFDSTCGTTNATQFDPDTTAQCAGVGKPFLCGFAESPFSKCMEAINCKMMTEMRVENDASDPTTTFFHQMIPHHANAVNMAKILMLEDPSSYDDTIDELVWEIINVQNKQIMTMTDWLAAAGKPANAYCALDYDSEYSRRLDNQKPPSASRRLDATDDDSNCYDLMTSAGSCYDSTTHVVTCDVAEADCPGYDYPTGYMSGYSGCCHCGASCNHTAETGSDCMSSYYDDCMVATESDGYCYGACSGTGASRTCWFEFSLDPYATDTGYYNVAGCSGSQPTLVMEANVTYTFYQTDPSNWYHPLGFSYKPDGAHKDNNELEPQCINDVCDCTDDDDSCCGSLDCQRPLYYGGADGTTYLGGPDLEDADFGLDVYEPLFQRDRETWGESHFNIKLTIDNADTADIFYFCHVHNWMSGRIKVCDGEGTSCTLRSAEDTPALYSFYSPDTFDSTCGTTNATQFDPDTTAGAPEKCYGTNFLCGVFDSTFSQCLEAVDCKMNYDMRVENDETDPTTTFLHSMIPHHANAVNMAKVLMKEAPASWDSDVEDLVWNIINVQNKQIMTMTDWLAENGKKYTDWCSGITTAPSPAPVITKVGLSLAMDGLACTDYGTAEEAVMNTALASHLDGVDESNFGDHVCTDVSRRRALKTSSVSIYTEVSVDATAYADDDIASAVSATVATAVSSGAFASSVATAASSAGITMSATVTGATTSATVDDNAADDATAADDADDATVDDAIETSLSTSTKNLPSLVAVALGVTSLLVMMLS
jgi:uncharacterized protein (DUF305 family)